MNTHEESPLNSDSVPKKYNLREKIKYVKDNITVEPVITCYIISNILARLVTQNLNFDKACRVNMKFGDKVCDSLIAKKSNEYQKKELAVQELIASMEVWKQVLLTALPSILVLFMGAWSDRTKKRKICFLLPIIGDFLMFLTNIVSVFFFYELSVQITMCLEAIFPAITGNWVLVYMGTFSYISDISSEESRTFRIGIASLCFTAGQPIGSALSGILLNYIGYYGVYSFCAALNLFGISYGIFFIQDPEKPNTEREKKHVSSDVCGFFKSFFNIRHVRDTLAVAFKKGPNYRRTKSILILTCIVLIHGPDYGEGHIRYLFTRYCFNWDALKYSFYNTFQICIHALGGLISISLFSRYLKWHDSVLGLISNCSKVVGALATSRAKSSLDMYLAMIMEMFNATSYTALRSLSSKIVSSDEVGKMTSFFNMIEVLATMVFGPVFFSIYKETLAIDTGTVYYVSIAMTVPTIFIFGWFFAQHIQGLRNYKEEDSDKEENSDDMAELKILNE